METDALPDDRKNKILQKDKNQTVLLKDMTAVRGINDAEKPLKEMDSQLFTLLDNLPGIAYRCKNDADWTMKFISSGCKKLTGYKPEELINNKVCSFVDLIHSSDKDIVNEKVQKAISLSQSFIVEYRLLHKSGKEFWVWEQGREVKNLKNDAGYIEGFIMDITERKQAENELQLLKSELENQVEAKTRELKERVTELERFNRATVEREFRIKELRDEISILKKELQIRERNEKF